MIAGNGWWNFTMPSCVAAGDYLMRVELIGIALSLPLSFGLRPDQMLTQSQALHSAYGLNGAQFYMS